MNQALVIIAHGSRKKETQQELKQLTQKLSRIHSRYKTVEYAFLEISKPALTEVIAHLAETNINQIDVFPYFLNSGKHVNEDIPELIHTAALRYPTLDIQLLPHFGTAEHIPQWIMSLCSAGYGDKA